MKEFLRDALITVGLAAVIFFGLKATLQDYIIRESSMEPNFLDGQRVLVNKVVYKFRSPSRGDVIILRPPTNYDSRGIPYIKRIIGLPGEAVEIKNNTVYIHETNGEVVALQEPYQKEQPSYTMALTKIPADQYFVLGDNRNISNDSHRGWTVPGKNIIGKAWISIWPPGKWGIATVVPAQRVIASNN